MSSLLRRFASVPDSGQINQRPSRDEFAGINQTSIQAQGLMGFWPLWEPSGAYAMDYGPFGMHMTPSVNTLSVGDPMMGACWYGDPVPAGTTGAQSWRALSRPYSWGTTLVDPVDFGALPNGGGVFAQPYMSTAWINTSASALTYTTADGPPDTYIYSFDRNDAFNFPGHTLGVIMQVPNGTASGNFKAAAAATIFDNSDSNNPFGAQSLQIVNDGQWHLICGIYIPNISSNFNNGFQYILVDGQVGNISGLDNNAAGAQPFGFSQLQSNLGSPQDATHAAVSPVLQIIGADDNGVGSPFLGMIADHRFYGYSWLKYTDPLDIVSIALQQASSMYAPETRWELYRQTKSSSAINKAPTPQGHYYHFCSFP